MLIDKGTAGATRWRWWMIPGGEVRRYSVIIGYALRPIAAEQLGTLSACCEMPEASLAGGPAHRHRQAATRRAGAAGRLYLRGLPQCGRHSGHAPHPGHHHHGAMRGQGARLAVRRIKSELLPGTLMWTTLVGLETQHGWRREPSTPWAPRSRSARCAISAATRTFGG